MHEEASKQTTEDQASYDLTKQQLTQEVAALRKTYQDLVDANRDKEQMLRKVCNDDSLARLLFLCLVKLLHIYTVCSF